MTPAGIVAFGIFFAAVAVLLGVLRKVARRAEDEHADEVLRAEFDALEPEERP